MFEIFLILIAFLGSLAAGIIDLKTTEIPDQIPYVMMGIGIAAHVVESFLIWSYWPLLLSFIYGLVFLGFGFIMYYTGQWGGGDAKLLSAIGFLLPTLPASITKGLLFPFPLSFVFNLFLIGAFYMLGYALFLSLKNKRIWEIFVDDIKANSRTLLVVNIFIIVGLLLFGWFAIKLFYPISFSEMIKNEIAVALGIVSLFLIWRFTKTVEDIGFKKKIPVSRLREGDVLLESRVWEGLTVKQVKRIKASNKKHVWIKEGVRFGLAFPLALLFTLLIGDGILILLSLL